MPRCRKGSSNCGDFTVKCEGEKTPMQLLCVCAKVNGPVDD